MDDEQRRIPRRELDVVRRRVVGLGAVGIAAVAAACQLLEGIQTRVSPPALDAAAPADVNVPVVDSGTPVVADAAEAGCAVVPPPPTAGNPGGDTSVLLAVQSFYYSAPDGGALDLGYNLDCVDTCPGPKSCRSKSGDCDLDGGRDIAGNTLLSLIDTYGSMTGMGNLNSHISNGNFTMILEMTGWNGTLNDPSVSVAVLVASGIVADAEAGTTTPPRWDGTDVWEVDPRTVTGTPSHLQDGGYLYVPKALTTTAYVTNNQVVAVLPTIQFGLGVGTLTISNGVFVANLVPVLDLGPSTSGYRLQGQLGGRVSLHTILGLFAIFKDPTDRTQYLCGSDPLFQQFRAGICGAADIMSDPLLDNATPLADCDAVSLGLGFTAITASLGYPYPGPPIVLGCDGGVEDCPTDGG